MRISRILCAAAAPALLATGIVAPPALANGQNGTTLTATTTASILWEKTFSWELSKTADPTSLTLEVGDEATVSYAVTATKGDAVETAFVKGQTCVTNGGSLATEELAIRQEVGVTGNNAAVVATSSVDLSAMEVLLPGATQCYPYSVAINPADVRAGQTYKSTANVTITNHSGSLGTAKGPSPSATAVMPAAPTLVDNEITINDTNGMSWTTDKSDSWTYEKVFTGTEPGTKTHTNTVTANTSKGEISASADVTVHVNAPTPTDPPAENQTGYGRTPGYWKNHTDAWPADYSTTDTLGTYFSMPKGCEAMTKDTLLASLSYSGGPTLCDKARNLLRIGTSAVLSAAYYGEAYGDGSYKSAAEVTAAINTALAKDAKAMDALQKQLDAFNNGNHGELPKK